MSGPLSPLSDTPSRNRYGALCAIVVTYYPDDDFKHRLDQFLGQFEHIHIVDNGSTGRSLELLREIATKARISIIFNRENLGIATALNQGVRAACDAGHVWGVTFDQDTAIFDGLASNLVDAWTACPVPVAAVGTNYINAHTGRPFHSCASRTDVIMVERRTLITSGTLMNLPLALELGGFREDYFIDFVDHEFCLRARSRGYHVAMACRLGMSHAIGSHRHFLPGRLGSFPEHSPERKYYFTRNLLATVARYGAHEPIYAMRQSLHLVLHVVAVIIFSSNKIQRLYRMLQGVKDAIRGQMGCRHE